MHVVELNFATKKERTITVEDVSSRPDVGVFYWLTIGPGEEAAGQVALEKLGANKEGAADLLGPQHEAHYMLYDDAIHFSVVEAWLENGELRSGISEFLLGRHYLAVMDSGKSPVMDEVRRIYREDFHKFARTSGFLLFEMASQLLASYRRTFHSFTAEVEKIQMTLFGQVTDEIFISVSRLTADILTFRRMVLASRDLLKELATRKSEFVSETTQPSLDLLADRIERLGDDLEGERTVLTETLNLYMGMVSHRTNRIINRLTIFSMIFLPLSFLCGVYGMNFEVMPELGWQYGYVFFWSIAAVFVVVFITIIKKKKWI